MLTNSKLPVPMCLVAQIDSNSSIVKPQDSLQPYVRYIEAIFLDRLQVEVVDPHRTVHRRIQSGLIGTHTAQHSLS